MELKQRLLDVCKEYGDHHFASCLSALPIIEQIYEEFDFDNDVFILSKGHACKALFTVLEYYGYNPDFKQQHPDIDIENGVSCTTGSLGHGLPLAVGMAVAKFIKGEEGTIHVLLGDGECAEGTTWESLILANELELTNLHIHVDYNGKQAMRDVNVKMIENLMETTDIDFYGRKKEYPHVMEITDEKYEEIINDFKNIKEEK